MAQRLEGFVPESASRPFDYRDGANCVTEELTLQGRLDACAQGSADNLRRSIEILDRLTGPNPKQAGSDQCSVAPPASLLRTAGEIESLNNSIHEILTQILRKL